MKSFRLHGETGSDLIQSVLALLVGVAVFLALHYLGIADTFHRVAVLLSGAGFVGYLCRGQLSRKLKQKYPNARGIPVLAFGFAAGTLGFIARFVVPNADEGWFTLAYIIPTGVCIATFVFVNRNDPDVMQ